MSLINDMLRDLDRRHYPGSNFSEHTVRGIDLKKSAAGHQDSFVTEHHSYVSARGVIVLAFCVVAGSVLLRSAHAPTAHSQQAAFSANPHYSNTLADNYTVTETVLETATKQQSLFQESSRAALPVSESTIPPSPGIQPSLVVADVAVTQGANAGGLTQPAALPDESVFADQPASYVEVLAAHTPTGKVSFETEKTARRVGQVDVIVPKYIQPPRASSSEPDVEVAVKVNKPEPANTQINDSTVKKREPAPIKSPDLKTVNDDSAIQITHRPLSAEQQLESKFHQAAQAYQQGNYATAEQLLQAVLQRDHGYHQARLLLLRLYTRKKSNNEAELLLNNALTRYPQHTPYVALYAQMLAQQGRDFAAIEALQKGLPAAGDNADYHALLAGLYQRAGRSSNAAKSYTRALQLDPTQGQWWVGLGIASEQTGEKHISVTAYTSALKYSLNQKLEQYVQQRLSKLAKESPGASKNVVNEN